MYLDKILTGKIRVQLLLNPLNTVYLRGLERYLGVSSNIVREELNKLSDMCLINKESDVLLVKSSTKTNFYPVNTNHPPI